MDDAQREVIAFLRDPASHPGCTAPVEVIETHISLVFLAGSYAYKLKRAVTYPYLDFSTPERRLAACTAELKLNRRTAPQLYLEVRAITRLPDGRLAWGRGGGPAETAVDFVVVMRRFSQDELLDSIAEAGRFSAALGLELAAHIAQFHQAAEVRTDRGGGAAMAELVAANLKLLRGCCVGEQAAQVERIAVAMRRELACVRGLLDQRRDAGCVRRCHGDLHLRNICLIEGQPLLFDCLEFSDDLAIVDVLYDLAFLLMDVDRRGDRDLANLVLNRYLDLTGEDQGLAALPLFIALRAVIRGHVTAARAAVGAEAEIQGYLDAAESAVAPVPPRLIAIGGLSGTGKSTLAAALAPGLGRLPGARLLRSDVLRKLRLGSKPEDKLPPEAYGPEITAQVYRDLCQRAATVLAAGYSAVIDAVALHADERRMFAEVAERAGVPFTGLWLEAPTPIMFSRVAWRRGDASDANRAVVELQLRQDVGVFDWTRIDASGDPAAVLAAARRLLTH